MSEASPPPLDEAAFQKLSEARALFDRGDYLHARKVAESLASGTSSPEIKQHAADLLSDMSPPGLTKYLLALTLALLSAVTLFAYLK